ncbi:MAG: ankyrin repeat domain-containing protein [Capsulimonadaceae bacterium]
MRIVNGLFVQAVIAFVLALTPAIASAGAQGTAAAGDPATSTNTPVNAPLIQAAVEGRADEVAALIAAHSDVNVRDDSGSTPLILAIECGHTNIARLLIAAHADLNVRDNAGDSALSLAVKNIQAIRAARQPTPAAPPAAPLPPPVSGVVAQSKPRPIPPGRSVPPQAATVLGDAAANLFGDQVGAEVASTTGVLARRGTRAAHIAMRTARRISGEAHQIYNGAVGLMAGNATAPPAHSPRRSAARPAAATSPPVPAVTRLAIAAQGALQRFAGGSPLNAASMSDWAGLIVAGAQSDPDLVPHLVEREVNGGLTDRDIVDIVCDAVKSDASLAHVFGRRGAPDEQTDAIVQAAIANNTDLLFHLLLSGDGGIFSDVALHCLSSVIQDVLPDTPLAAIAGSDSTSQAVGLVQSLLNGGANVNARDPDGTTALMLAARSGLADVTHMLLLSGADASLKDLAGNTALQQAVTSGASQVVSLLQSFMSN